MQKEKKFLKLRCMLVLLFTMLFVVSSFTACEFEESESEKETVTVDFESLSVSEDGYWNGSDESGSFTVDDVVFSNTYNSDYSSWYGVSYSTLTDMETEGYSNQYSVYSTSGVNSSKTFCIMYLTDDSFITGVESKLIDFESEKKIKEVNICTTTYSYLSMKNGDGVAKKFGGDSGDDEDWFKLTIRAYDSDENTSGEIEFYLADFRFSDGTKDYIIDEWTTIDLSSLGSSVKTLSFELSSSDSGQFGMNTPAYFALDNLVYYK